MLVVVLDVGARLDREDRWDKNIICLGYIYMMVLSSEKLGRKPSRAMGHAATICRVPYFSSTSLRPISS